MNDVVNLALGAGYRVADTESGTAVVECERGCGWRTPVRALSTLPAETRDQLFRYHDEWHAKRAR